MVRHDVEDEVVALPTLGEVFLGVIDDVVCAERADHVNIPRATHPRHFRAERLGNLHRERTYATRRTVDQDSLARLHVSLVAQGLESHTRGHGNGRDLLKCEARRLRHEVVLFSTRILGEGGFAPTVDLVTWSKLRYVLSDRLNRPGDIGASNTVPWFAQPVDHAHGSQASHDEAIGGIDRSRVNAYQHLVGLDCRFVDISEFKDFR